MLKLSHIVKHNKQYMKHFTPEQIENMVLHYTDEWVGDCRETIEKDIDIHGIRNILNS